jgi:hypothetical protein
MTNHFVGTRWLLAVFVGIWLTAADHALAAGKFALIIGNGDYASAGDLPNALNDATLIEQSFKAVGFETRRLVDLGEDAMGEALDDLAKRASSLDVAAVYYAGHAIQKDGKNYMIPVDARLESETAIARETIDLQSFMDVLEQVPISLLFLDACRNNPFAEQLASSAKATGRSAAVSRGLAVVRPQGDMLIAFATLPNTVASDGTGNNSPFAIALSKHMKAANTEISVVMKRVTADVVEETDGNQRPQQLSQMGREFYMVETKDAKPVDLERDPVRAILSVYPDQATTGEEIAMVADVLGACQPAFFDLSSSGKVTPIPLQFFKQVVLGSGQTRYEISPGSRYGLVVQDSDERGKHTLGFFCEPAGLDKDAKIGLLRELKSQFDAGSLEGVVKSGQTEAKFLFQNYQIR